MGEAAGFSGTPAEGDMLRKIRAVFATQPNRVRNELREGVGPTDFPRTDRKGIGILTENCRSSPEKIEFFSFVLPNCSFC